MFESLTKGLNAIFDNFKNKGVLKESDVTSVLKKVRLSLLDADVSLHVVNKFIKSVYIESIGKHVVESIKPGQMVVKIVHDNLVKLLGNKNVKINLNVSSPAIVMMLGLQGSGKTTSTAKLGLYLQTKLNKKVLMSSLDIYRPAAQTQLEILGQNHGIKTLPIVKGESPLEIAIRSEKVGRVNGYDVIILDTAGRLHINNNLIHELESIKKVISVSEMLLVGDAMTGQDAVNIAKSFHQKLSLTGIILTRVDGDARGGAALSMTSVTGCPIKFVGVGEDISKFEVFHPDRMAKRILGMGDIVTLVERAVDSLDKVSADRLVDNIKRGAFNLNDLYSQLEQMKKMGGIVAIAKMLPGFGKIKSKMESSSVSDKIIIKNQALISSMTLSERFNPNILNASRKRRIVIGAGAKVSELNRLLKQFKDMKTMMQRMEKSGSRDLFNIDKLFKQ